MSTDTSGDNATATNVLEPVQFDPGTRVDIVITTTSGTQTETSYVIEETIDPKLSPGDEIRLN